MSTYYQLIESYLVEAKKPRKSDLKKAVRKALKDAGYNSAKFCKDAVVYTDHDDFKKNQKNMWGGVSGDIQKLNSALKFVGPGNVVDVFVYDRCYTGSGGPSKGDLVDNVVVHLPIKRGQSIKKARQGTAHVYRADLYTDIQESVSYAIDPDVALIEASVIDMEMGSNGRLRQKGSSGSSFLKGAAAVALITAVAMIMKKFMWPKLKSMFGKKSASDMTAAASKALVAHVFGQLANNSKVYLKDVDLFVWRLEFDARLDVRELVRVVADASGTDADDPDLEKVVRKAVQNLTKMPSKHVHGMLWHELSKRPETKRKVAEALQSDLDYREEVRGYEDEWEDSDLRRAAFRRDAKQIMAVMGMSDSQPYMWIDSKRDPIIFMAHFPFSTVKSEKYWDD